jgi:hypothetical protein
VTKKGKERGCKGIPLERGHVRPWREKVGDDIVELLLTWTTIVESMEIVK